MPYESPPQPPPWNESAQGYVFRELQVIRDELRYIRGHLDGNGHDGLRIKLGRVEERLKTIEEHRLGNIEATLAQMSLRRFQLLLSLGTGSAAGTILGVILGKLIS